MRYPVEIPTYPLLHLAYCDGEPNGCIVARDLIYDNSL